MNRFDGDFRFRDHVLEAVAVVVLQGRHYDLYNYLMYMWSNAGRKRSGAVRELPYGPSVGRSVGRLLSFP